MPSTPSMDFFDKFKDTEEGGEPSQKRHQPDEPAGEEEAEASFDPVEDDEEGGRFFGGGLTSEQTDILDLVDQYDAEEVIPYFFFAIQPNRFLDRQRP